MEKQRIAILGSTGSIGTQVLEIVRQHPDRFEVIILSANGKWELLAQQVKEFQPRHALICNEDGYRNLKAEVGSLPTQVHYGIQEIPHLVALPEVDTVVNSLVGFSGFLPTVEAIRSGKKIALANKESLVVGGALITELLRQTDSELVPIDSEHSAMLQCLVGESSSAVEKIVITASGGPFRDFTREQMEQVTVEQALKHPNWDMGAKITIDSATMMNKGLEIIEARWLFDLPLEKIEPVIHPQSIIHSMITFVDGSTKAQLGYPDMKVPIIYALTYPDRLHLETPRMDWTASHSLTFSPVDYDLFPCVKLAMDASRQGGTAPCVLNAANEIAVRRFLDKEISYIQIPKIVEQSLEHISPTQELTIDSLITIDKETRTYAQHI